MKGNEAGHPHEKAKILLVDDRPANLLVYEVVLAELDEELVMAHSGEEALKQVESQTLRRDSPRRQHAGHGRA